MSKTTMTTATMNAKTMSLIEAIFEAVTRSESWNGAHVVYRNGEFSAEPGTARIGIGGVVMSVSNPQDFWGSESVEGLMEYLTENAADFMDQANEIIEENLMEQESKRLRPSSGDRRPLLKRQAKFKNNKEK